MNHVESGQQRKRKEIICRPVLCQIASEINHCKRSQFHYSQKPVFLMSQIVKKKKKIFFILIHMLHIDVIYQWMQYMSKQNRNKLAGPEYSILQLGHINCQFSQDYLPSIHHTEYCSKSYSAFHSPGLQIYFSH